MGILMPVETQLNMKARDLELIEYDEYYSKYLKKIPSQVELGVLLNENRDKFTNLLDQIAPENLNFAYANEKWSLVEVLQHIIDVERIFQYRALSIARDPGIVLPGFDHEAYVPASNASRRSLKEIKQEFIAVRNAGIALYNSFTREMLLNSTKVGGSETSCRAIGFIVAGHTVHHIEIIKENYLYKI